MSVVFFGCFTVFLGMTILFLPLLFKELSRPRDSIWGALMSIQGLILITSYDRFNGSAVAAVIFQVLVFARLILEIGQHRWQVLSLEEKTSLKSIDRLNISIRESFFAFAKLGSILLDLIKVFQPKEKTTSKKWIRPDKPSEGDSLKDAKLHSNDEKKTEETIRSQQIPLISKENLASKDV